MVLAPSVGSTALTALGPFGHLVLRRLALHATAFVAAALVLFFVFDLVEAANTDLSIAAGLFRSVEATPRIILRTGKFALLLGGLTAARSFVRTRELVAWLAAGGRPGTLLLGTLATGLGASILASALQWAYSADRSTPSGARWLRLADRWIQLHDVTEDGRHVGRIDSLLVIDGRVRARGTAHTLTWTAEGWRARRHHHLRLQDARIHTSTAADGPIPYFAITPGELRVLMGSASASPLRVAAVHRRFGQPYRTWQFVAWRRWSDPLSWWMMAALGFGLALTIGIRGRAPVVPLTAIGLGFAIHTIDELSAASVDSGLVPPGAGALLGPILTVLLTVTVWRIVLKRGIRD